MRNTWLINRLVVCIRLTHLLLPARRTALRTLHRLQSVKTGALPIVQVFGTAHLGTQLTVSVYSSVVR